MSPALSLIMQFITRKLLLPAFTGLLVLAHGSSLYAQDSSYYRPDSLPDKSVQPDTPGLTSPLILTRNPVYIPASVIKRRTWIVGTANVVGYSTAMIGLYNAWYKNYPQGKFHTFNDWPEWKQTDKVGHFYSAYTESRASMELWRWAGMERKKRIWIGGMSGAIYQTVIEVLDGFSSEWGWSWADFSANILGSGALVAQELAWDEQRIKFKFSFHRKRYDDPELNHRSDELFGRTLAERFLKDYNGQTYWASVNLKPFFKNSRLPDWLSVAVGYGTEGLFGGTENIGKDDNGNIIFSRPDIRRYRQWFIAPDIDLTKIRTNKKGLRLLFTILSAFKFPAPSIEYGNGRFTLHAVHF